MKKLNIADVAEVEQRSPGGKFHSFCRNLSLALGGIRGAGLSHGGHPFDLQIRRIPAGAAICPFHLHVGQWELFYILSGQGVVRTPDGLVPVIPGDLILQQPGDQHQIRNPGSEELVFFLVADNPATDVVHYPDSNKWGFRSTRKFFRLNETDYWDGEEKGGFKNECRPDLAWKTAPARRLGWGYPRRGYPHPSQRGGRGISGTKQARRRF